ncbi:hypothetical protein GCM10027200_19470 [Lentzea nigeriaca]
MMAAVPGTDPDLWFEYPVGPWILRIAQEEGPRVVQVRFSPHVSTCCWTCTNDRPRPAPRPTLLTLTGHPVAVPHAAVRGAE